MEMRDGAEEAATTTTTMAQDGKNARGVLNRDAVRCDGTNAQSLYSRRDESLALKLRRGCLSCMRSGRNACIIYPFRSIFGDESEKSHTHVLEV